jgi:hypothetical protein
MSLLIAHLALTLFLSGLIWTVQIVHYPLFSRVGPSGFIEYEKEHQRRISLVVGPLMILEAMTASLLLWAALGWSSPPLPSWAAGTNLGLLALTWLSTLVLQVPQHRILSRGFDPDAHARLVRSNWIRTGAWSVRSTLLLVTSFIP